MKNTAFLKMAKTSLVLVYLVIIAGATVRMTGSGMGCPDWPKCFGYYIPPTDVQELTWEAYHEYEKGQVIIKDEKLFVAKETFTSDEMYHPEYWKEYTKHDYAEFNPMHTWVEYINRLFGALAGVACFILGIMSFRFWKTKKSVVAWSWIVVFLLGFNAWLGATVVYSVLSPVKITTHMIAALLNVAALIYVIHLAKENHNYKKYNPTFKFFLWISMILTLIQVGIGTQVREFVDHQVKAGIGNEFLWLQNPDVTFYVHRTFSIIVLLVNLYLYLRNKRLNLGFTNLNWVMLLLLLEIGTGIAMNYFGFPFGSQAAHLVLAAILYGIQFSLILDSNKKHSSLK